MMVQLNVTIPTRRRVSFLPLDPKNLPLSYLIILFQGCGGWQEDGRNVNENGGD